MSTQKHGIPPRNDFHIEEVPYEAVLPFKSAAVKDGITMSNPAGARWFAAVRDGKIIGFASLLPIAIGYRIRSNYVEPNERGQGVFRNLANVLLNICEERCASIEVLVDDMEEFWLNHGFRVVSRSARGVARMMRVY